jgi:hypothetical protein
MSEFYQYLAPAGNGIHTVHTAKERKQSLHEALYQTSHDKKLMKAWKSSLEDFDKNPRPPFLEFLLTVEEGFYAQPIGALFLFAKNT